MDMNAPNHPTDYRMVKLVDGTLLVGTIAVDEKYSSKGTQTDKFLVFKIINELKKIVMKIKGINTITIKYGQKRVIHLKKV